MKATKPNSPISLLLLLLGVNIILRAQEANAEMATNMSPFIDVIFFNFLWTLKIISWEGPSLKTYPII